MKLAKHIAFYYYETREQFILNILSETTKYPVVTDIFIHTNKNNFWLSDFDTYTNGNVHVVFHNITQENRFSLTEKPRPMIKSQRNDYDIFMYIEDDILFPVDALLYWMCYNEKLIKMNYNLGFLRIETSKKDKCEYITDLYGEKMDKTMNINNQEYCVNNKNAYCACWIYNKEEFGRFVDSKFFDIENVDYDGDTRASCAAGLHGKNLDWYKYTIIPMDNGTPVRSCKIFHMSNNYVDDDHSGINKFATIKFDNCIDNK